MCCFLSTPTALSLVVSTVEQPAANAPTTNEISSLRFIGTSVDSSQPFPLQEIGKNEACCRSDRRHGECEPRPGHLPGPSCSDGAHRAAGTVADAREKTLAARLRPRRKTALPRSDGRCME